MSVMANYVLAFLIGAVAGLRSMTAPAAICWAAHLGWLHLEDTPVAFLGYAFTPYIFTVAAIGELIADKLPKTPSRKTPGPFAIRAIVGDICGACIAGPGHLFIRALLGALGAVAGTMGGYEFRRRLVKATGGKDFPIALLEDAIAICAAFILVFRTS
jgi:uncharacterized membrane protein